MTKKKALVGDFEVIKDVSIVTVRTIKQKHLNQMEQPTRYASVAKVTTVDDEDEVPIRLRGDIEVVGRVPGGKTIFRNKNDGSVFCVDFLTMLALFTRMYMDADSELSRSEADQKARDTINGYPQLFVE